MSRKTGIASEHVLDRIASREPSNEDYDAAIDALDNLLEVGDEVTLTMRAEETKRLIQKAFAEEPRRRPRADDEITVDQPGRVALPPASQRLPTLMMLAISPPASRPSPTPPAPLTLVETTPPASRWRPHVTPELAQASYDLLLAEDAGRRGLALKRKTPLWLVAGIWAMALSILVVLALFVTKA